MIPTLDEEGELTELLPEIRRESDLVVVSDGGSRDGTRRVARELGADVVEAPRGRGTQLNRGARRALELGAKEFLFLHADTRLPRGARDSVVAALASGAVGGGFFVRFDEAGFLYRFGERVVNLRTRATRLPLGDQAQFVRSDHFVAMAGFRDWPLLEDLDFARRLKRGGRIALIPVPVVTSARRYVAQGPVRTVAKNWAIWALFTLGVPVHRLARWYGKGR